MVRCSTCKKDVNDIRPQIDGVGVCFECGNKPLTKEAIMETLERFKRMIK